MTDRLDNGEDVTDVSVRDLALRAVNMSLLAKASADRVEESMGRIARELGDIRGCLQTLVEMLVRKEPSGG